MLNGAAVLVVRRDEVVALCAVISRLYASWSHLVVIAVCVAVGRVLEQVAVGMGRSGRLSDRLMRRLAIVE